MNYRFRVGFLSLYEAPNQRMKLSDISESVGVKLDRCSERKGATQLGRRLCLRNT